MSHRETGPLLDWTVSMSCPPSVLEGDTASFSHGHEQTSPLSSKAVCYRDIPEETVQNKEQAVPLLVRCTQMQDTHREWSLNICDQLWPENLLQE